MTTGRINQVLSERLQRAQNESFFATLKPNSLNKGVQRAGYLEMVSKETKTSNRLLISHEQRSWKGSDEGLP